VITGAGVRRLYGAGALSRTSYAVADVTRFAAMTNGAARSAVLFEQLSWRQVFDTLNEFGAAGLISKVRAIERDDPTSRKWPRNKRSDDATAAYVQWGVR
jgi:hypothetical protein